MAKDWFHSHSSVNVELRLISERTNLRQYNAPTVAKVAALITNDFGDGAPTRDIIKTNKDSGLQRILELHPSYMALQYPLLFPYGEDGYHDKISYHSNTGTRKTNRGYVTMKEYYTYVIQYKKDQGTTLLRGGRTFPRHMMQNYQDAIALCRAYGNPDLFITFTSNPKWPVINEMLAYVPRQRAHDRPEVGTKVFKLKLTELLDDLTKNKTPDHIDDKISAELPSLTDDPVGYKAVTDHMLLGPCGKDARYVACNVEARTLTYAKILQHYVWHEQSKIWKPQKQRKCIGRIVYSTPAARERYFLRMLLNVVKRPQSFEELLTVNKRVCVTFKEACFYYGLLNDDREWTRAIQEASF
ncbi:helicase [Tanacetum coccineum]